MKNRLLFLGWIALLFLLGSVSINAQKYKGLSANSSDGQNPTGIFNGQTNAGLWQDSENSDDAWLIVDLGSTKEIGTIKIFWENANAKDYNISFSTNGIDFFGQMDYTNMVPGNRVDVIADLNRTARYVKMQGVTRQMNYGYAIFEFEIYAPFDAKLSTLSILPKDASVEANKSLQLSVVGYDQIGNSFPVTGAITWQAAVGAEVTGNGRFTSSTPGIYTVTASANGLNSQTQVEVKPIHPNIAVGKTYSSSSGNAVEAFDGNQNSRWESTSSDPQWILVDLGSNFSISDMIISWEAANAKTYKIEYSLDEQNWTPIAEKSNMPTERRVDRMYGLEFKARYIRLTGLERNTVYGYSIWEFEIFGRIAAIGSDTEAPSAPSNFAAKPDVYAIFFTWTPAVDNVGVTSYKLFKNGTFEALVDGNSTSMTLSGLEPKTTYSFSIRAYDANGNESDPANLTTTTKERFVDEGGAQYGIGNIALSMPTEHSELAGDGSNASVHAVDGSMTSRWESAPNDDAWMNIDLGLKYYVDYVIMHWEVASGKQYLIQVSDNNRDWITVAEFKSENELPHEIRTDKLRFDPVVTQFIRFQGVKRNTPWGYSLFEFEVYSPGSGPDDIPNPNPNPNPDPVPPGPAEFSLISPINQVVLSETRQPLLTWESVVGATSYEVWVNITKSDYDWHAWGSLLDRFTKMGEVSSTQFQISDDLSDRWTYKWYVVAKTSSGIKHSDLGLFSVYLPKVTQIADGISKINGCRDLNKNGVLDDYENWKLPIEVRVNDLMSKMTIHEKAMQMFYNAQSFPESGWAFGPGTIDDMFQKQKAAAQTRLGIPFVSAGDNKHGYKTTYPVQTALAATKEMQLAYECANMQRVEQLAVGARGVLGPLAEVGTKVLYPRIQEGCGEDAEMAAAMMRAMICGFQGGPELNPSSVMVTTKHWPGQGAGGEAVVVYDAVTAKYHLKPWFGHMDAGGATVMPGYAGSTYLDPGGPGAGDSKKILTYLREVVKFEGPVCTDWLPYSAWVNAANAGSDIMGGADPGAVGFNMQDFINNVPEWRINEAVKRILTVKFKLGVFEDPYGDPINGQKAWATPKHKNIALDAARKAMTLVTNNGVLPLNNLNGKNILITGSRANDGDGYRIWTSYFNRELGAKTMYESLQERGQKDGFNVFLDDAPNPDIAIVVVGEPTYTHGTMWELEKPWIHDAYFPIQNKYEYDKTTLDAVKALGIPMIVVVVMPRPYIINDLVEMADAVLIAYRTGDAAGPALTEVLLGDYSPTGRLPWQLPRSMAQIGEDHPSKQSERWDLPFDLGATAADRQEIRSKIARNEPLFAIYGDPLFQYGYGIQDYAVDENSDLPTKIVDVNAGNNETSEVMKIYPNPVKEILYIELPAVHSIKSSSIYTMTGTLIQKKVFINNGHGAEINLSQLSKGIYFIKIESDMRVFSKMIIKE